MHKRIKPSILLVVITGIATVIVALIQPNLINAAPSLQTLPIATDWDYPMDNFHVQENIKWGTTVENTNYDVRNLDLVLGGFDKIICFDIGAHRAFHAGIDLYPASLTSTAKSVRSVAAGQVVYRVNTNTFPGGAVIVKHRLPNNSYVYSVYMHLQEGAVQVVQNQIITKGQLIGFTREEGYSGRFPEFHPDGDDTHLHFEIRNFQDAVSTGQFPQACDVAQAPGVGYTYPNRPDSYGYFDPLVFIKDHMPPVSMPQKLYLPLIVSSQQVCQEGKDLLLPPPYNRNPGFEFANSYSAPWHEISNFIYFSGGQPITYPFVQSAFVLSGNQSALLNSWGTPGCCGWSIIDEELVQSVHIPEGVATANWTQLIQLRNIEPGDRFIIDLKDARTGHILANMEVIDENSGYQQNQIYQITYALSGALAGKDVSLSYSSISDNDTSETNFVLDNVSFVTHCGASQNSRTQSIQVQRSSSLLP